MPPKILPILTGGTPVIHRPPLRLPSAAIRQRVVRRTSIETEPMDHTGKGQFGEPYDRHRILAQPHLKIVLVRPGCPLRDPLSDRHSDLCQVSPNLQRRWLHGLFPKCRTGLGPHRPSHSPPPPSVPRSALRMAVLRTPPVRLAAPGRSVGRSWGAWRFGAVLGSPPCSLRGRPVSQRSVSQRSVGIGIEGCGTLHSRLIPFNPFPCAAGCWRFQLVEHPVEESSCWAPGQ